MKEPMNIAAALNRKYVRYTYVMLISLFENNKGENIRCFVLHSELIDEDINLFRELAKQYGNEIVPLMVDKNQFVEELPTTQMWSIETYYRLMLPNLMPKDIKRLLYLDVDIIVLKNLREFYSQDFEDKNFVVCKDVAEGSKIFMENNKKYPNPVPEDYVYFNAGVMLWNMENIRKIYSFNSYIKTAKELNYNINAPDQDLLNYMHWNQIKYADERIYNRFAYIANNRGFRYKDIIDDVAILHFAGRKPWNADGSHFTIEQIWWDYAKITPFYNELCHEFVEKTMQDNYFNNHIKQLYRELNQWKNDFEESLAVNQKMVKILQDKE